jgi:hypothetical protein
VPVITSTAARDATNQREMMSSPCHSSRLKRGMVRKALPHIAIMAISFIKIYRTALSYHTIIFFMHINNNIAQDFYAQDLCFLS